MNEDFLILVGLVLSLMVTIAVGMAASAGYSKAMHDAFERGHAVECLGKSGYFWDCEE